jgi:hypothetical protein
MLGAALLIGGLAAFPAAGRADHRIGVAASGAFGPLLVAVAYVLAAPRAGEAPAEMSSAFTIAPYTVIAGLAGSLLVAVVGGVPARASSGGVAVGASGPDGGPDGASPRSVSPATSGRPSPNAIYSAKVSAPQGSLANPSER